MTKKKAAADSTLPAYVLQFQRPALLVMESPRLEKGDLPWLEPDYVSEDDSELNYFHYRTHFEDKRKQWQDGDKVIKIYKIDFEFLKKATFFLTFFHEIAQIIYILFFRLNYMDIMEICQYFWINSKKNLL